MGRIGRIFCAQKKLRDKLPDQRMPVPTEMDVIKVKNSTGDHRNESEVVELAEAIISEPTRLHPWLNAIKMTSRCARYGVLRYATGIDKIRWCQVSGPTFALVDLTNGHTRCSPKEDLFHFVGDDDGPIEILWKPDEESGVHECLVELEQVVPPSTYVAKIPEEGIPARDGSTVGRAVCEIYKLTPHDYNEPEAKTIEPILKPNGDILTKEIYNVSLRDVRTCGEDIYAIIHREECGNWFVSDMTPRNTWYTAKIGEPLCPDDRGEYSVYDVEPVESPEPASVTAQITRAINRYGRAARTGYDVLIMRKYKATAGSSGSGEESGASGAGCEYEFLITQVLATCADMPATNAACQGSGSGSGDGGGVFLVRESCGSGSGAEGGDSGSGGGCAPIQGYVQRQMAIETCSEEPELVDQLELEMQDAVVNINMDGCPTWVNAAICVFGSCLPELEESAECEEVCPESGGGGSG